MDDHLTQFYHTCWLVLKATKPKSAKDMALIEHAESATGDFLVAKAWFRFKQEHPRMRKAMDDIELVMGKVSVIPKKTKSPSDDPKDLEDEKNGPEFTTV